MDGIEVDRAQGAVELVVFLGDRHDRGQHDELILVMAQLVAEQAVDVLGANTEQLVVAEVADGLTQARVDDPYILQPRGDEG